ncbi:MULTISPECIES: nucleobase:cation symporter-2 family protein [Arthrobacter]|uniref:Purine permease n=1 Tax=Arthrobacter terricola TaxID=2547396 RepID=A0A4R5KH20_9MICC|nr:MULTISPECIES: nucleobase:cation symporter-2 family protein [Arthrobacter]MBT8159685.1 purine permease [Arthrobacter sp. GN70]TDF93637.1 purine permease [Arthrobacter terricola]
MMSRLKTLRSRMNSGPETHPVDELLPPGKLFTLGAQHMLAAYAGIIAPPFIIGTALHLPLSDLIFLISASLLASGLTTLLQTLGIWKVGVRLPLVQGVSFSGIASMIAIGKNHPDGAVAMQVIVGAVIVAAAVMFFLAPVYSKLLKFFPPLVMGSVVTVIGLSLIPISIGWMQGTPGTPDFGSMKNVFVGIVTLVLTLLIVKYVPGFTKRVGMLVAMVLGTLISIPLGLTDFSQIGTAKVFEVPSLFHFGAPKFDVAAIISMLIVMLVIMTEATADMLAIGDIVERPVTAKDVANGLRADCLGSVVSGGLNGFQASAYGQNIGLLIMSRVKSRYAVAACGIILIVLALFPITAAVVATVPLPVLGGAGIAIFGLVAVNGVHTLSKVDFHDSEQGAVNALIVAATLTMGILPIAAPNFYAQFPSEVQTVFSSGIASGAITAIVLNILLNELRIGRRRRPKNGAEAGTAEPLMAPTIAAPRDLPGISIAHTDENQVGMTGSAETFSNAAGSAAANGAYTGPQAEYPS